MFDKTNHNDIAELKASLSHISKMHPEILDFLRDICFYDVPNTAVDTNQHLLISGAKNVYLVLKQVMREDLTPEQIAKTFKGMKNVNEFIKHGFNYAIANVLKTVLPQYGFNDQRNAVDVTIQDQYTGTIDLYFCTMNAVTTLSAPVAINQYVVTVTNNTGAVVYDCIEIRQNGRCFQSLIAAVNGNNITLLSPTDQNFTAGAIVNFGEWDISMANGSVAPVLYVIRPPVGVKWDIYKINFTITDEASMDDGKFGGITQLSKGLVFRYTDGYTKNMFSISNNAGFREYGFETVYTDKAPKGQNGYNGFKHIRNGNGVSLRLDGDTSDSLQIIVQDDLTALTKVAMTVQGHVVN